MTLGKRSGEQGRGPRRGSPTEGAPLTDFAITTVNVPDRLDMQELRAREDEDDQLAQRRGAERDAREVWGRRFRRLLVPGLLALLVGVGYLAVRPLQEGLAAPRIAEQLTRALGQRVTVGESSLEFSGAPHLRLRRVDVAGRLRFDEVRLGMSWEQVVRSVSSRKWAWSEAVVPSLVLTRDQAFALVDLLPALKGGVPAAVSSVRLASVGFPDFPLLPGRYGVVLPRQADGSFGPIELASTDGYGQMRMRLMPRAGDQLGFQLEASDWIAPAGPAFPWTKLVATGHLGARHLEVESFSGSGFFGDSQGAIAATNVREWVLTGSVRSTNVDLPAVFRHLGGPVPAGAADADARRAPLGGLATLDLRLVGQAATLSEAIRRVALVGAVEVRNAQLYGVNLGLAATQGVDGGGLGGGLTRFSELGATVSVAGQRIAFRDIAGVAGAMTARGQLVVDKDLALSGVVRVEIGSNRVTAPVNLRVGGTALAPEFGR